MLNRLTGQIADICRAPEELFKEKWLLAPTRRIGYQWLDSVALSGCSPFNFHVKTSRSLALELATPVMKDRGLSLLGPVQNEVLISRVLGDLRKPVGDGYLLGLPPGPGLNSVLSGAIRDLRLAGLAARDLTPHDFHGKGSSRSLATKARELISILECYEVELAAGGLVDYAGALLLALGALEGQDKEDVLVLAPEDLARRLTSLEGRLLEALPFEKRMLAVDAPGPVARGETTDLALLRYINEPGDAPRPSGDGTVEVFRAVGEVNEVREVLRRCGRGGIPLDDVEIVCTDSATFLPIIYEMGSLMGDGSPQSRPFSFSEGIPVRYSRPARALLGWLEWVKDGAYPQWVLGRMIQGGLLRIAGVDEGRLGFAGLARAFRSLPVYATRERYLTVIDKRIGSLSSELASEAFEADDEDESAEALRARVEHDLEGLKSLRGLFTRLLGDGERSVAAGSQKRFLDEAHAFLGAAARATGEFDEYCATLFMERIEELAGYLSDGDVEGLDVAGWLAEMARDASVGGSGPRPGCAYVSSLKSGGHSGRGNTFIIGLDDSRFPGAGLEDPVLLDSERETISGSRGLAVSLPTAAARLSRDVKEDFAGLLSRLRGKLTLSYCSLDLVEDREMFPSRVLLAACRIASGQHQAGYGQILKWKPLLDPASFAPTDELDCVGIGEWWLWLAVAGGLVTERSDLGPWFPNLARGAVAAAARRSAEFTEYDGLVPRAGADFLAERPVLSATALELLGRCPMEYFFKYVLGVEAPEEHLVDPYRWLPGDKTGTLLHSVFREFMAGLGPDERPAYDRHRDLIQAILAARIAAYLERYPDLSNPGVYQREVEEMEQTADEFLLEMQQACATLRPLYFEVGIGMPPRSIGGETLCPEPVELRVSPDLTVRARGGPDRIDVETTTDGPRYVIWDYKTGSSARYDARDPFRKGRQVQSALYMRLLAEVLAGAGLDGEVSEFIYFFPRRSEHRRTVRVGAGLLPEGLEIIGHLAGMLSQGCFPASDDRGDLRYGDYKDAFGDLEATAGSVKRKKEAEGNQALEHFKGLRGTGRKSGSGKAR
ncbi:MAG TPA: PD-(D/E)XK nuclease family protein [Candidatus Anoxymicrobiaceae bacterium]